MLFEVLLAMRWDLCNFLCYMLFEGLPRYSFSLVIMPMLALQVLSVSHTGGGGSSKESLILKVKI